MDGKAIKLLKYLDGSDKRFIIPVYQRNYSWKVENCRQLYDDLVKLIRKKRKLHFFGSLVSVYNGIQEEFLIIDGQQRVTTISLLLLAMHNILKEKKLIAKDDRLIDKIFEEYLVDKYAPSEKRIKLKAVNKDLEAFEKLFDEKPSEYIPNSDVTINYQYFYDRILKEEITIDELYEAVSKLMVINITVGEDDNPQLIFESLNSTGVDLTEGDKIRNYVLMGQSAENQEAFYKKYWSKIELCTGNNNNNNNGVSLFVRDYLSVKRQSTPSMDKIYVVFKAYVNETGIAMEELLNDLLYYAQDNVKKVWERTKYILNSGRLTVTIQNNRMLNNLPAQKDDPVSHVRPHGATRLGTTYLLPEGTKVNIESSDGLFVWPYEDRFPTQCFWLNNSYILSQLNEEFKR